MNTEIVLLYVLVSFFYILSPGPAVFLAITNGVTTNMKVVAISSLANILGLFLLSTISTLGLGVLLLSSSMLFMIVKIIGSVYLVYLGIKQLLHSRKSSFFENSRLNIESRSYRVYFMESFLLAATNPKPILFFVALFPQFIITDKPIAPQFFTLTAIFMVISFLVLCGYGYISKSARGILSEPSSMQWFHRITGGLFVFMGLSLLKLKNSQS